jgi:nucleoside-diphosphate-sugar epimerase
LILFASPDFEDNSSDQTPPLLTTSETRGRASSKLDLLYEPRTGKIRTWVSAQYPKFFLSTVAIKEMSSSRHIFLLGPGYIGAEILSLLTQEGSYQITTMIRRPAAAAEFENLGIKVVLGTLDDREIIVEQVSQADIVVHTATADHLPSVESVIQGAEIRAKAGKSTIYIHTSGASLLGDQSAGEYLSNKIFYDDKPADIDALPDDAPHRMVDLAIIKARQRLGKAAKLAIMIPPVIYGVSSQGRLSIQLPTMARYSIKHGYAGHIGKGLSVWSQVHIKDLARAYVLLLHWLEGSDSSDIYENPYFFCENGSELSWGECAAEIGRVLHQRGLFESPDTKTIPRDRYDDIFGPEYTDVVLGSNSRNRAHRLRKLGWGPREKETLISLREEEVPLILKEDKPFSGYSKAVAS